MSNQDGVGISGKHPVVSTRGILLLQLSRVFLLTVSIVLAVPFLVAGVDTASSAPSFTCLVCGKLHENQAHPIQYKGRTLRLCSPACLDEYRTRESAGQLDTITARIEPRSALFQEDSNPRSPLSAVYLGFGLYVLAGILFGGWLRSMQFKRADPAGPLSVWASVST